MIKGAALTLATTVPASPDTRQAPDGVYEWDWTATTHDARDGVVDDLVDALAPSFVIPHKGMNGWTQSVRCYDAAGYDLGSVYFGGRDDVAVQATSDAAAWARSAVAGMDNARTSRVDTRFDTLTPYEDLQRLVIEAASTYNAQVSTHETLRGPKPGRTIYLGAPSSAIRVRVYEKWIESPGQYVDGTNRVEVQLRPASKVKDRVSAWTPQQTFCASKTTRDLAALLGADATSPGTLHVKRATPTLEQSLAAMGKQYGPAVARYLELQPGGWDTVLAHLVQPEDVGPSQGPARLPTAVDRLTRLDLPPTDLSVSQGRASDGSSWPRLDPSQPI